MALVFIPWQALKLHHVSSTVFETKNLQTERKTLMAEQKWICLFLPVMYTVHAFDIYCAMLQCSMSASCPLVFGFCISRTGNGYYYFIFSGSGTVPGTCSVFGECLE